MASGRLLAEIARLIGRTAPHPQGLVDPAVAELMALTRNRQLLRGEPRPPIQPDLPGMDAPGFTPSPSMADLAMVEHAGEAGTQVIRPRPGPPIEQIGDTGQHLGRGHVGTPDPDLLAQMEALGLAGREAPLAEGIIEGPIRPPIESVELPKLEPDLGEAALGPSLTLDQPVSQRLRSAMTMPRKELDPADLEGEIVSVRERLAPYLDDSDQVGLDDVLDRLRGRVKGGLALDEDDRIAALSAERVIGEGPLPGSKEDLIEADIVPEESLDAISVKEARDIFGSLFENEGAARGALASQGRTLDATQEAAFQKAMARTRLARLSEAISNRAGRSAAEYLSDKPDTLARTNLYNERRGIGEQYRQTLDKRRERGVAAPTDRRNAQLQEGAVRTPFQEERLPNPEAITGLRPGAEEDPFENVRSGRQRSVVVNSEKLKALREQGLTKGTIVFIDAGDGRRIPVTVTGIRKTLPTKGQRVVPVKGQAASTGAVEPDQLDPLMMAMSLRQGLTPATLKREQQILTGRQGPQWEIEFQPAKGQWQDDPISPARSVKLAKIAKEDVSHGIGARNPRPQLPLRPDQVEQLRELGFGQSLDAVDLPKAKATGVPRFLLDEGVGDAQRGLMIFLDDASEQGKAQLARLKAHKPGEDILKVFQSGRHMVTGESSIKKKTRPLSKREFAQQPRDQTAFGATMDVPRTRLWDPDADEGRGASVELPAAQDDPSVLARKTLESNRAIGALAPKQLVRKRTLPVKITEQPVPRPDDPVIKGGPSYVLADPDDFLGPWPPQRLPKGSEPSATGGTARFMSGQPERRDVDVMWQSAGREVSRPEDAVRLMRKGLPAKSFLLTEHYDQSYRGRTKFNAENSDATLILAANPTSAGSRQTREMAEGAGKLVVPVDLARNPTPEMIASPQGQKAVHRIVAQLNGLKEKKIILNLAGNSGKSLAHAKSTLTQDQLNTFTTTLLKAIHEHPGKDFEIVGILSGGQTGADEAGAIAGRELGIPTTVVMPAKYTVRDTGSGIDVWTDRELQKKRFAGEDISGFVQGKAAEAKARFRAKRKT